MSEYVFPLRIVNPDHGAMHVYDMGELERHRKLGWAPEGEKPAQSAPEIVALPVVESAPVEAPAKRKPGRPRKAQ